MKITKTITRLLRCMKSGSLLASALLLICLSAWALPHVEDIEESTTAISAQEARVAYRGNHHPASPAIEQSKKVESLQQELQELRGKLEEQAHLITQLQEQQKKLYLDLDRRLREGGPTQVGGLSNTSLEQRDTEGSSGTQGSLDARVASQYAAPAIPAATPATLTALPPTEQAAAEEKVYQSAYQLIQNKEYDGALTGFKALVSQFPQGTYTPNGYYWLGEIYLVKGDLALAAQSFDIVFRRYPQHPKAADALLKLGYIEYANGRWKQSQKILNQVKTQFPGSTSAQLAQSRLDKMQQEGH